MMELSNEEMQDLKEKVDRIFVCVVGDKQMGSPGLVDRIDKMEKDLASMKLLRDRIIIGTGIVAGILWFLGQVGEKMLEFFAKK